MSRIGRISARLVAPGALYHLLASTAFVVVFAIVPFSLYMHSGEEWALTPVLLLKLAALGLLALLAVLLGLRLLAALSRGAAVALALGLFCLGLFVLLAHVYAPVAIGPLDGNEIRSDEPLGYTLIEGALLAGAVVLFVLLRRGRGLSAASVFAGVLWLVGLGYGLAAMVPSGEVDSSEVLPAEVAANRSTPVCSAEGNVYQIVLDTLETDAFLEVIRYNGWAGEFQGFDLFFNNIANYMLTRNSKASYLTGMFYHSGDLEEWWGEQYAEGLFRHLPREGFVNWTYAPLVNKSWQHGYAHVFRSNFDIYREHMGEPQAEAYDFLSVWLTSLAPNALTSEAIPIAAALADRLYKRLTSNGAPTEENPKDFHRYASVLLLEQVILDEPVRAPDCNYVYAHAVIPHAPYVLDGACRYVGEGVHRPQKVSAKDAYLQQTECSLRKVISFLRELKRLRRYDASTILLHADTGSALPFRAGHADNRDVKILGKPKASLLSVAQALLMVKRPHGRHALEVIETPTQLVDVYPTILDILDMEELEGLHGRSIYDSSAPPREARFALDPEKPTGPNLIEVRVDHPTDLGSSTLTAVGPATDPAVWRDEIRRARARSSDPDEAPGVAASSPD